jgi:hypothetical protein
MCKHGNYAIMNLEVEIDKCMVPLIKALQKFGIKTRACCCGHGKRIDGKKINNHIILSAEGAEFGMKEEDGIAGGWKKASDFNVWGISFPIKKSGKK